MEASAATTSDPWAGAALGLMASAVLLAAIGLRYQIQLPVSLTLCSSCVNAQGFLWSNLKAPIVVSTEMGNLSPFSFHG